MLCKHIITVFTVQDASAVSIVSRNMFMTGRIQNNQCEYVDVPHAVNAGEKGRCEFQVDRIIPSPLSLGHLQLRQLI